MEQQRLVRGLPSTQVARRQNWIPLVNATFE